MTRRRLHLNWLRAFEAAARLGRMTAAAEELAVTHGAISRQVSQLAVYLNVRLFEGAKNNPVLTPAGAALLAALTPAFDQMDAAVRATMDGDGGLLDVACYSTFAVRWLIPRLHRFQNAYSAIEVRLSTDNRRLEAPRRRHDVSILALGPDETVLATDTLLFAEQLGILVAPGVWQSAVPGPRADLATIPQLATRMRPDAWDIWCKAAGTGPALAQVRPGAEFEHYAFTIEATANGMGACVAPLHLVAGDVRSGRLLAPFGFVESGYRYIARIQHPGSRKAARFAHWLRTEASEPDGTGPKSKPRVTGGNPC